MPNFSPRALVVCASLTGLMFAAVHYKFRQFATGMDARDCLMNQNTVDKCIGVWESQNFALDPSRGPLWIEFDVEGRIATVSDGVRRQCEKLPAAGALAPGSEVMIRLTNDPADFRCPAASGTDRIPQGIHYRWEWHAGPAASGRSRGTRCLQYEESGPPGFEDVPHRAWPLARPAAAPASSTRPGLIP